MYRGPERGKFHEWAQQKHSRRSCLRGTGEAILVASTLGVVGYVVFLAQRHPKVLKGKPITGEVKSYMIRLSGSNPPRLRDEPSLSVEDEIGTVEPGIVVRAMEIRDTPYPHNPHDDLCGVAEDGNFYCVWYKLVDPVPVQRSDGPIELRTGFFAGTFVDPIEGGLQAQQ